MKALYTESEFNNSKSSDLLKCECYNCNTHFYLRKCDIQRVLNPKTNHLGNFCSKSCVMKFTHPRITTTCTYCKKHITKTKSEIKRSKNMFCSKSCATKYNNSNKNTGTRRSKLECWLELKLKRLYPNLEIKFNDKHTIKTELDIYIPSLNVAFELNGIFHYEPIFGVNKLESIKHNDILKSKLCYESKIDLCIIDISGQKYFKESTSNKYLEIITDIINKRQLSNS